MPRRDLPALLGVVVLAIGLLAPPASAAKPTIERIKVDEIEDEAFLSEACGFPVTAHVKGHVTFITFDREGTGVLEVLTVNLAYTAMANGRTFRFRDVGANVVRRTPEGDEILMVIGQFPFEHIGVLKINLTTDEVILEPQHTIEDRVAEACAALSP